MTVYVMSFYGNDEMPKVIDGVYGVFDSQERAFSAVGHHCVTYNETIHDYDVNGDVWRYFTNKGTYVVEAIELNDEGIV